MSISDPNTIVDIQIHLSFTGNKENKYAINTHACTCILSNLKHIILDQLNEYQVWILCTSAC